MFYIVKKEGQLDIVDFAEFQKQMGLEETPIMSMEQMENLEAFAELQENLFELRMRFDFILGNIQQYESDPMMIHMRVSNLLDEYQVRLDRLMEVKEKQSSAFFIKRLSSGGARWFGWATNRWEDRESDILSEASHIEFKEYLDKTGHIPVLLKRHDFSTEHKNKPDWYDYAEGFFMYSGMLTDAEADAIEQYQKEIGEPLGMSHRFLGWPVNEKENVGFRQFDVYRTFEVSYLPLSKAANPYTGFFMEEKGMDKVNFSQQLKEDLGEELLAQIRNKTISAREALESKGINTKEYLEKHANILPDRFKTSALAGVAEDEASASDADVEVEVVEESAEANAEVEEVVEEVKEEIQEEVTPQPAGLSAEELKSIVGDAMSNLKSELTEHFENNLVVNAAKELQLDKVTASIAQLEATVKSISDKLAVVDGIKGDVEKLMKTDEDKMLDNFFGTLDFTSSPTALVEDTTPTPALEQKESDNRFAGMAEMFGSGIFDN